LFEEYATVRVEAARLAPSGTIRVAVPFFGPLLITAIGSLVME
jgi:hypothetical protein